MTAIHGRSEAVSMLIAAGIMRLFTGFSVEYCAAGNAAWLNAAAGIILLVPFGLGLYFASRAGNDSTWNNFLRGCPKWLGAAFSFICILLLSIDCAAILRLTAVTANITAHNDVPLFLLLIPLIIVLFLIGVFGSAAEGNSARIWLHILPLFILIIAAVQFKNYEPDWLNPILGNGLPYIADGGLTSAGWLALIALSWIIALPDRNKSNITVVLAAVSAISCVLLAAGQMLVPVLSGTTLTETARIKLFLSNGRIALSIQLILLIVWYGNMLHLMSAEAVTAVCFLRTAIPALSGWVPAAIEAAVAGILAAFVIPAVRIDRYFSRYIFIIICAMLIIMLAISCIRSKEAAHNA